MFDFLKCGESEKVLLAGFGCGFEKNPDFLGWINLKTYLKPSNHAAYRD